MFEFTDSEDGLCRMLDHILAGADPVEALINSMTTRPRFQLRNTGLAEEAELILMEENPMTLRQLFYRCVSAGLLSNEQSEYKRLGVVMTRLREAGCVPRTLIVDNMRQTSKPSSWTGLADFGDTVRDAYRKDLWSDQTEHVEVFVEKDAVAGTIKPVTERFDVGLNVCRGYASISFAGAIADEWALVDKPIHAYYAGDFDPSGFDIERDLREKLERYSGGCEFSWHRLAVQQSDFDDFDLMRLPVKTSDRRAARFIKKHGNACAELDAIPPQVLRDRVQTAIESHIDQEAWVALMRTEKVERESVAAVMGAWKRGTGKT